MVSKILNNYYETGLDVLNIGDKIAIQEPGLWRIYKIVEPIPSYLAAKVAIDRGYLKFLQTVDPLRYNIVTDKNPTINDSYEIPGVEWFNYITGETFKLQSYELNGYPVWVGDKGTVVAYTTVNTVDVFGDGNCIALYQLDKDGSDLSGEYDGKIVGNVTFAPGVIGKAVYSSWWGQIQVDGLPFDSNSEELIVSAYIKWNGINYTMPFGFKGYDIYVCNNYLGFNTANADLYGFNYSDYAHEWHHILVQFKKYEYGRIWIDGVEQTLTQKCGRLAKRELNGTFAILGWRNNSGYQNFGAVDHVRILKTLPTDDQIEFLATERERQ